MERGRDGRARPHSVHYAQHNGEADSDKENQAVPARGQMAAKARPGQDTVITASTWLSNILPAPREEGSVTRELSPSPQHRAVTQVQENTTMSSC